MRFDNYLYKNIYTFLKIILTCYKQYIEMILNEGKRDRMLQPYVDMLQAKGIDTNISQLKSAVLKKLADNAGMHNLSLQSNFYLAGAARYYFNGDLTVDGNVGLITGEPDEFNNEICSRLNALIVILRNAYIDTVGQTFEQPEDFGTMKIGALLKKYNSKINKELGIDDGKREKVEVDTLNRNEQVSPNYTFEICYKFEDATKYERDTAPGSWCVTYGVGHFNTYTKGTSPQSHLVVFRQNGWQEIERTPQREKWIRNNASTRPKPQDDYGNSLIAFFQSNESYRPALWYGAPLITSRWNHGSRDDGTNGVEADQAYTFDEFKRITGVSDEELQRIYEIWKKDSASKSKGNEKKLSPEEKAKRLGFLRMLKYAQMRANGGEQLETALSGVEIIKRFAGQENFSKGVYGCKIENNYFVIDRGQIAFDTIIYNMTNNPFTYMCEKANVPFIANSIILKMAPSEYSIYNFRLHKIIEVDGLKTFASVGTDDPYEREGEEPYAILCKQRGRRCVFFDSHSGMPVRLPNGRYIFEYAKYYGGSYRVSGVGDYLYSGSLAFIMYDSSSLEAYVYNPSQRLIKPFDKNNFDGVSTIRYIYCRQVNKGFQVSMEFESGTGWGAVKKNRYFLFDNNCDPITDLPNGEPYSNFPIINYFDHYIEISYDSKTLRKLGIPRVNNRPYVLYNTETRSYLKNRDTNKVLHFGRFAKTPYSKMNLYFIELDEGPSFIDLDNEKIYHPVLPSQYTYDLDYWGSEKTITENYIIFTLKRSYNNNNDLIAQTLKNQGYAIYVAPRKRPQIYIKYDDVIAGRPTMASEFNVNALPHPTYENKKAQNTNIITEGDIVEMVKTICERLINNE